MSYDGTTALWPRHQSKTLFKKREEEIQFLIQLIQFMCFDIIGRISAFYIAVIWSLNNIITNNVALIMCQALYKLFLRCYLYYS